MDRGRLVNEILMLLPTLMRFVERPSPVELGEISHHGIPMDVQVSPGHIQVLLALTRGPRSVGQLAQELEVSPPAATQLVDRLAEHGMVERHNDMADRRVVLVDYVPGMHEVAQRIVESRRGPLERAMRGLTDEEALALVKGLKLLAATFGATTGEEN